MKIRLTGTRDECAATADTLRQLLTVREVSAFYSHRGTSLLGRVYLDAEPVPRSAAGERSGGAVTGGRGGR